MKIIFNKDKNKLVILIIILLLFVLVLSGCSQAVAEKPEKVPENIRKNVKTTFNDTIESPEIGDETFISPLASVIGNVELGDKIMVAPGASIRGDEGQPLIIGDETNVQDGVVIHALETEEDLAPVEKNIKVIDGETYAVYIGKRVSLAHQSQVHGPAIVMDDVFVGMQALVFKSEIGKGSVIEPGAKVVGVKVAAGRYVPTGMVLVDQAVANKLPKITPDYKFATLNKGVIHVNTQLAEGYSGNKIAE